MFPLFAYNLNYLGVVLLGTNGDCTGNGIYWKLEPVCAYEGTALNSFGWSLGVAL